MKQDDHKDVYRVAFDSAQNELNEIVASFEQLRARKESVEKLVAVLKPIVDAEMQGSGANQPFDQASEPAAASDDANNSTADPFQRRIDHVLGIANAGKYSQRF
jgi:hypothetical protein